MAEFWYFVVVAMIATYVVLDGFDFGVGLLQRFVTRNAAERAACIESIGPVWDGNEVWLVAGGGCLYMAFPALYAQGFSGFYLPLMLVLWLLVLRAIAIELRHQLHHEVWATLWDSVLAFASGLLALVLGAAVGNLIRGVPVTEDGSFFIPLWTDFSPTGAQLGVLDAYTILVGVAALCLLSLHGGLWLLDRVEGEFQARTHRVCNRLFAVVAVLLAAVTAYSFAVQPRLSARLGEASWGVVFPILAAAGFAWSAWSHRQQRRRAAFLGSCILIYGLVACAAYGTYPYVLVGANAESGLTLHDAAAPAYGLGVALWWWMPAACLVLVYHWFVYTKMPRVIRVTADDGHVPG